MNTTHLVNVLARRAAEHPWNSERFNDPSTAAFWLNNKDTPNLPDDIPNDRDEAVSSLREHFGEDVALVSLFLHHEFPEEFVYWRFGRLERPLFRALEQLSEDSELFDLPVDHVGRHGVDAYLELNPHMLEIAEDGWPNAENSQACLQQFLLDLGALFLEREQHNHYWVICTEENPGDEAWWSGNEHVKAGDVVFFYQSGGPSAITDIFQVAAGPHFDPVGAWDGFWMGLEHVTGIEPIPIADMREHDVVGDWNVVRRNFQGVVTEPIPYRIYNGLLEFIANKQLEKLDLQRESIDTHELAGDFGTEAEFEDDVVEPLLKELGFQYDRQHPLRTRFGSSNHTLFADFAIRKEGKPLSIVESKLHINDDADLEDARDQAKSYALQIGAPTCIVAAPEGLWLYEVGLGRIELHKHIPGDDIEARHTDVREWLRNATP